MEPKGLPTSIDRCCWLLGLGLGKTTEEKKEEAEGLMTITTSTRVLLTEWRESDGG